MSAETMPQGQSERHEAPAGPKKSKTDALAGRLRRAPIAVAGLSLVLGGFLGAGVTALAAADHGHGRDHGGVTADGPRHDRAGGERRRDGGRQGGRQDQGRGLDGDTVRQAPPAQPGATGSTAPSAPPAAP